MGKRHFYSQFMCLGVLMHLAISARTQQARPVTGTVLDETGEPIIGAAVMVEGTSTETVTDIDGKFSISVPSDGKLKITFIGYIPQVISDMSQAKRVVMKEDQMKLDEVVAVGYGTQNGKNVTGSIEVLNMDDIQDLAVTNLSDALSGMINSLHVNTSRNKPGEAAHLTIRQSEGLAKNNGQVNTKFSTQDDTPLYIIDDFFFSESAFNALDPSEVESISVLKDAAAAIYGAQGAYGVILVKTKRGKVGVPKVSYSGQFGFTDALVTPKMMNAYEYARIWNAYKETRDASNSEVNNLKNLFQADELEALKGVDFDLLNQEWKAALTQRYSVNVNGGTERGTYFRRYFSILSRPSSRERVD